MSEIRDIDVAWLAGAIEGDGSVGMGFHEYRGAGRKRFGVKPIISFSNQDPALIEHVSGLFAALCGKAPKPKLCRSNFKNGSPTVTLQVVGQADALAVARAIQPYLVSDKKRKAELLIQFIESRLARRANGPVGFAAGNAAYSKSELCNIVDFYSMVKRKGGGRNSSVGPIIEKYLDEIEQENVSG